MKMLIHVPRWKRRIFEIQDLVTYGPSHAFSPSIFALDLGVPHNKVPTETGAISKLGIVTVKSAVQYQHLAQY